MADDDRIPELLNDYGHKLTTWEQDFLESLDNWDGELTERQLEKLDEVYERVTSRRVR